MLVDPVGMRRLDRVAASGSAPPKHPKLVALRAFWDRQRTNHPLPARQDFSFNTLKPWLGHVALVEVVREPLQFRVRLFGTRLAELAGKDLTGQFLDRCFSKEQINEALDPYYACVRERAPITRAMRYQAPNGDIAVLEQQFLPCSSDQATIGDVVCAAYLLHETAGGAHGRK